MSVETPLQLIGFWSESSSDGFVTPDVVAGRSMAPDLKGKVLKHLRSGTFCGGELGFSSCRFRCGIADELMGSAELSDGVWAWPEGLAHYVDIHDTELPAHFIAHVENWYPTIDPGLKWEELVTRSRSLEYWRQWCVSKQRGACSEKSSRGR